MTDVRQTAIDCPCGEEIALDDDWQPGDVVRCDFCATAIVLVLHEAVPFVREVDAETAQQMALLAYIFQAAQAERMGASEEEV